MTKTTLTISKATQRRFILGLQGLYPGRRWRGKAGVLQALQAGCVVQIDPLCMIARSHDLALHSRVLDYQPEYLNAVLYEDRAGFDWGGTLFVYPMEDLPYVRIAMGRKQNEPRWLSLVENYSSVVDTMRELIRERGPMSTRDVPGEVIRPNSYRSGKDSAQAMYYMWLSGELMTHSRRGFERLYDLRERVIPAQLDWVASADAADDYFARKVLRQYGLVSLKSWRNGWMGMMERKATLAEAEERMAALVESGTAVAVQLEEDPKTPRYLLAETLPALEALHAGRPVEAWQPLESTTAEEAVFLAPLEIVSARGRAQGLFDFEYIWEVYKPVETRRWGYYTLPILFDDKLVARFDSKLDRATKTLHILGFWLEPGISMEAAFETALSAAFQRLMGFLGAEEFVWSEGQLSLKVT